MLSQITKLLKSSFHCTHLDVRDDSAQHAGHAEALRSGGGHYSVMIIAEEFSGKTALERHRMVHAALKPLRDKIHALALTAKAAGE